MQALNAGPAWPCLVSSLSLSNFIQDSEHRCQSASQARPPPPSQPLTAAVAGTAGILLEVGDESVAWAAGGSEALA